MTDKKDAYYFKHDSNAKDDPKCVLLIETLQLEGYGIFWVLIETLRDQPEYKYPLALLPAIARRYNSTIEKVKAVVFNFGLFEVENDDFFYSNSLKHRMIAWDEHKQKYIEAGKASGRARKQKAIERRSNIAQTSLELLDKNKLEENKKDTTTVDKSTDYIYFNLFELWNNTKGLRHSKLSMFPECVKSKHKRRIDLMGIPETKKAIENYCIVINSDEYYFNYVWPFWDFIWRGLDKFIDEAKPFDNFKRSTQFSNTEGDFDDIIKGMYRGER